MADDSDKKKKERVLHTRISEALDQELRSKAAELGMSVSKLVRNVLVNTVDLVETVVSDTAQVADRARMVGESFQPRDPNAVAPSPPPESILAWQRVTLNLNALCESCNAILPKGTEACLGLAAGGVSGVFRCVACIDSVQGGDSDEHEA
jgi:hypothetical protein